MDTYNCTGFAREDSILNEQPPYRNIGNLVFWNRNRKDHWTCNYHYEFKTLQIKS